MLEIADEAVRLASADARAARRLAADALAAADDLETRSTAERALGLELAADFPLDLKNP